MKKIILLVSICICIVIIIRLIGSIYTLWHKKDLLVAKQQELLQVKKENQMLKNQLTQVQTQTFIEEQARDRLLLVKPGEQEVVISPNLLKSQTSFRQKSQSKPNWQQWWELFF